MVDAESAILFFGGVFAGSVIVGILAARSTSTPVQVVYTPTSAPVPDCHLVVQSVPDLVTGLFRCDPTGWSSDTFYATYRDGMTVWIADSDYGIEVQKGGGVWGGVHGVDPQGQKRIWDAYQAWAASRILTR